MRFDAPRRPGWRDPRAELRRGLVSGRLPVFGAAESTGGRFGGWETSDDVLVSLTVEYGEAAESWVEVETACWAGTIRSTPDLRETLKHHLRIAGVRFADVTWSESEVRLSVDGREIGARMLRAGDDWWVARAIVGEFEVGLTAYRKVGDVRIVTLPDGIVAEMLDAPLVTRRFPQAELSAEAEDLGGEPHRRLVHLVLRGAREQLVWLDEGGPAPRMARSWPRVWRAAILRQAELSGGSEAASEIAVQSMLSQLTSLQADAGWFREDERLRERAINETLLYATGLSVDVPSRAAQEAWREREGNRPMAPRVAVDAFAARGDHWFAAWEDWARQAAAE